MMALNLRRSATILASKRALIAGLSSVDALLHHQFPSVKATYGVIKSSHTASPIEDIFRRDFHAKPASLDFRASVVTQAEFAVADYGNDEEKGEATTGNDEGLEIAKLGISNDIVSALSRRGITKLFPIQKAVLEPAMQGRNMFGRARTGTGKTLAFGIPIMDKIIQFNKKHGSRTNPLALVMAPTRELARQVEKEFRESAPVLRTICLYGGTPISQQMSEMYRGVDVAVGTPGRIIDLMKRGALNLSEIQFVVLDEADQMLNVGFAEDVEVIMQQLPHNRQSLMFSATKPTWIRQLVEKHMSNPLTIDLVGDSDQKLADGITLYSIPSDMYTKASIICPLITQHAKGGKCIVFTQTKRDADQLAYGMKRTLRCAALHGDISQSQRERTLSDFRDGHFNVLVATDVAARGLDVPNVDLIIHYELPNSSETFVHRTGRTGRAGKKGTAIVVYTQEQTRSVGAIERDVGCKFTELCKITVEGGGVDMFKGMGVGGQFGTRNGGFGGNRSSGFGRSDNYGGSFSHSRDGYGGSSSGRFDSSPGFGQFGRSDRSSGGFINSPSSGFGNLGSNQSSGGGFGNSPSSAFGNFGSNQSSGGGFGNSPSSGFGNFGSNQSSGGRFGNSPSSGFGNFGSNQSSGGGFGNSPSSAFENFGSNQSSGGGFGNSPSSGFGNFGLNQSSSGGFGNSPSSSFGNFPSSSFENFGSNQISGGGFGNAPSRGFGNFGSNQSNTGGFGNSPSNGFGNSGAGRPSQFGDTSSIQNSGGLVNSGSSGFGDNQSTRSSGGFDTSQPSQFDGYANKGISGN